MSREDVEALERAIDGQPPGHADPDQFEQIGPIPLAYNKPSC